jgi:fatty-acyl-CoA synthase
VSGREHPQYGQTAVAQVVVNGNVDDPEAVIESLRAHCCARLSSYKVPVEFTAVQSLPKTASGKLARTGNSSVRKSD